MLCYTPNERDNLFWNLVWVTWVPSVVFHQLPLAFPHLLLHLHIFRILPLCLISRNTLLSQGLILQPTYFVEQQVWWELQLLCFRFSSLLSIWESSGGWPKCLCPCYSHGRSKRSSMILVSCWSSWTTEAIWRVSQEMADVSLFVSLIFR